VRRAAVSTLGKLDAATLAQHAPAILARLDDSDPDVRRAAVSTLGKLDAATLAQHAPAILARLEHSKSGVRTWPSGSQSARWELAARGDDG